VSASGDELIVLRDGFAAKLAPYLLVMRLEAEGFLLELDPDDHLYVGPAGCLAPADVEALRRNQSDVIRLLRYVAGDAHLGTSGGADERSPRGAA